jgi:hypothetical protein
MSECRYCIGVCVVAVACSEVSPRLFRFRFITSSYISQLRCAPPTPNIAASPPSTPAWVPNKADIANNNRPLPLLAAPHASRASMALH